MGTFYRISDIDKDGYFDQTYTELSDGQNEKVLVSGGPIRDRIGFWNIEVAQKPTFGAAELRGCRLHLYCNSIETISNAFGDGTGLGTEEGFSLKLYKTKSQIQNISEGDTSPSTQDILCYSSFMEETTSLWFDALDGSNFYSSPEINLHKAMSSDYTVAAVGPYISLYELLNHQRGNIGDKYTGAQLYLRYYQTPLITPSEGAIAQFGRAGMHMTDALVRTVTLGQTGGIGEGQHAIEYLLSAGAFKGKDMGMGASEATQKDTKIAMVKMESYEQSATKSGLIDQGHHHLSRAGNALKKGWTWSSKAIFGDKSGEVFTDMEPTSNFQVPVRWQPLNGRGNFADDIYVNEDDVTIKYENTDEIISVPTMDYDFSKLAHPPANTQIENPDTLFTNIRKAPFYEYIIQGESADEEDDTAAQNKVPIAMSNFVWVDDGGSKSAMMENLHGFYARDGTPDGSIKAPGGVDFLQEVRGQIYCPAPLNVDGADENDQYPFLAFSGKLKLPGGPFAHNATELAASANKITMRRALWLVFNRLPIGEKDILNVAHAAAPGRTQEGMNGFVIYEANGINHGKEYYGVSWIGDLDYTITNDPQLDYGSNASARTTVPQAYIPRSVIESKYLTYKFWFTTDGIKFSVMDGMDSVLYDVDTATGVMVDTNGPLPYISMSGFIRDDGTTVYDNIGEWTVARKYHIKSGTSGTGNNEDVGAGVEPTSTVDISKANVWASDITPQTFHNTYVGDGSHEVTVPDGHAQRGINGRKSAGLQMMWLPYFTISLTSTRANGHYTHDDETHTEERLVEFMKDRTGTASKRRTLDSHARFWIDNIGAYRFNYAHVNATINTNNLNKGKLSIPASGTFNTIKLASDGIVSPDGPNNRWNGRASVSKTNYAYLTFGFENKSEIEGAAKYFLMNGFFTDPNVANTFDAPNEVNFGMIYSDDSHPFGENHTMGPAGPLQIAKDWYFSSEASISAYNTKANATSPSYTTTNVNKEGSGNAFGGYMQYNIFGNTTNHRGRALVTGTPATTYTTGVISDSGAYKGFPNLNSLSPTADYDLAGNLRIENFNQAGIMEIGFNDSVFAEIGTDVQPNNDCCGAAYTYGINNMNNCKYSALPYVHHVFSMHEDGSPDNDINLWDSCYGVREPSKTGSMPLWIGPNLNWMVRFKSDTVTTKNDGTVIDDESAGYEVYQDRLAGIPATSSHQLYFTNTNSSSSDGLAGSTFNQHVSINTKFNIFPGVMVKRENPFAQARIMGVQRVSENIWDIQVDSPALLTLSDDQKYLVYHASREWVPTFEAIQHPDTYSSSNAGDVNKRQDGHLTVNEPRNTNSSVVGKELDDMRRQNKYCATIVTITQLGEGVFRCTGVDTPEEGGWETNPIRGNTNSANHYTSDTFDVIQYAQGSPKSTLDDLLWTDTDNKGAITQAGLSVNKRGYTDATIPQGNFLNATLCISPWRYWLTVRVPLTSYARAYSSMIGVTSTLDPNFSEPAGAGCAIRSTYNESDFTDSHRYGNYWTWDPLPDTGLELDKDFGYGQMDEDGNGGYVARKSILAGAYNEIPFDGAVLNKNMEERDVTTLVGFVHNDDNILFDFASGESTTRPPYIVTVFTDAKPAQPTDWSVDPDEDNPFYPRFSWAIEDDDLWYGFLIIDEESIHNQYHGAIFHAPCDWFGQDDENGPKFYKPNKGIQYKGTSPSTGLQSQSGYLVERGGVKHAVDGLQGFTVDYDGSNDYLELDDDELYVSDHPTNMMSINLHIVPRNVPTDDEYLIFKEYEYTVWLDSSQQINVHIYPNDDGDDALSPKHIPVELKSTSIVTCNDEVPTNIIITVDTGLKSGNVKLYINGKLEDQSGLRRAIASKNNWPTGQNINYPTNTVVGDLAQKFYLGCKYPDGVSTTVANYGTPGLTGTTINVISVDGFDSSGTIKIGSEEITYTSIGATAFLGCVRGANGTTGNIAAHASTASVSRLANKFYDGKMEEITIYNRLIHPITPKDEYFTYTQPKSELTTAAEAVSKSYVGKLFLKDYHNIRGVSDSEITSTPQISFRKAAFRLRTN